VESVPAAGTVGSRRPGDDEYRMLTAFERQNNPQIR
jgi:hypothetical protein